MPTVWRVLQGRKARRSRTELLQLWHPTILADVRRAAPVAPRKQSSKCRDGFIQDVQSKGCGGRLLPKCGAPADLGVGCLHSYAHLVHASVSSTSLLSPTQEKLGPRGGAWRAGASRMASHCSNRALIGRCPCVGASDKWELSQRCARQEKSWPQDETTRRLQDRGGGAGNSGEAGGRGPCERIGRITGAEDEDGHEVD